MAVYDLYGFSSIEISDVKILVEESLNIEFTARNSTYQGGDYYIWGNRGEANILIKRNVDPFDGEPSEMAFGEYPVLLYVNNTERSEIIRGVLSTKLVSAALLRHENL